MEYYIYRINKVDIKIMRKHFVSLPAVYPSVPVEVTHDRSCWPVFTTQSHTPLSLHYPVQLRQVGSAPIMFFKTCAHIHTNTNK